jgi:type VI secretion system protein ImpH
VVKRSRKALIDLLSSSPEKFSFVRAVDVAVSYLSSLDTKRDLRLKSNVNYSSKFSDVSAVKGLKGSFVEIYTNIAGIAGIEGTLPDCYVEKYITHNSDSKKAVSDFFDIFNEKILGLRYRYVKNYDLSCASKPLSESIFGRIIMNLSGIYLHDGACEYFIPEQFKASSQNLFIRSTRSSEGLRIILSSFFEVPIVIEQFVGRFVESDKGQHTSIGKDRGNFNSLGLDACLGNKLWDSCDGINIIIGPLDLEKYTSFLPKHNELDQKASRLQKLKEIARSYIPCGINTNVIFYLDSCFVKNTVLGGNNRLNKDAFITGKHERNMEVSHCERV